MWEIIKPLYGIDKVLKTWKRWNISIMFAYQPVCTNTRTLITDTHTHSHTNTGYGNRLLYSLIHYAWNNNSWAIGAFRCQTRCHRWRLLSARNVDGPWKAFNVPLNFVLRALVSVCVCVCACVVTMHKNA